MIFMSAKQLTSFSKIVLAIGQAKTIAFAYNGKVRVVEPYAVGTSTKDGSLLLRGYQVDGASSSGNLPQWRLFSFDKIDDQSIVLLDQPVGQLVRDGYREDDRQMNQIIIQVGGNGA